MPSSSINISLSAEKLFSIGGVFPVTNSLLTTWIVMLFLLTVSLLLKGKIKLKPGYFQSIFEIIIDALRGLFDGILHEQSAKFFPILATFFLFIIFSNWSGLLPGVGTIGLTKEEAVDEKVTAAHAAETIEETNQNSNKNLHKTGTASGDVKESGNSEETPEEEKTEFIPLFRSGTADLNTTLALAIIAVITVQYAGFSALGLGYLKKYFNFSNPIYFFVGILELIGEFARIISFAFRLFGNIFAGEVLLTVIAFLMPLFAPLPFLGLELFVGFIQALVFSMLAAVFLSLAVIKEH